MLIQSLCRASYAKTVQVIVGSDSNQIHVHLNPILLSNWSGYFEGACSDASIGTDKTITLLKEDPVIFSIFLAWLFTGKCQFAEEFIDCSEEDGDQFVDAPGSTQGKLDQAEPPLLHTAQFKQMACCYVLGEFLQAPEFQNAVIDILVENARTQHEFSLFCAGCTNDIILKVYGGTKDKDPLRRLMCDIFAAEEGEDSAALKRMIEGETNGLVLWRNDLLNTMLNNTYPPVTDKFPWQEKVCQRYHQHPGEPKDVDCKSYQNPDAP